MCATKTKPKSAEARNNSSQIIVSKHGFGLKQILSSVSIVTCKSYYTLEQLFSYSLGKQLVGICSHLGFRLEGPQQHSLMELSEMMKMPFVPTPRCGSHQPSVASEPSKCGPCYRGIEFLCKFKQTHVASSHILDSVGL